MARPGARVRAPTSSPGAAWATAAVEARTRAAQRVTARRYNVLLGTCAGALALVGCRESIADLDAVYYRGPGPRVLCAVTIDSERAADLASIEGGLDRARDEGAVLQLYGHTPGTTVSIDRLEAIAAGAEARGLASFTYAQLADGPAAAPGLALSFDDRGIDAWASVADLLDRHGVRATFFVTRYHLWTDADKAKLRDLAARGHAIEAHGVDHLRAPTYAEEYGVASYVADEVVPSLERLRADGFAPRVFAYPYGARTSEIDRAVLAHVDLVRSVTFSHGDPIVSDPCPW